MHGYTTHKNAAGRQILMCDYTNIETGVHQKRSKMLHLDETMEGETWKTTVNLQRKLKASD